MIEPFLYDLPTKIYFGFGKLDELPALLAADDVDHDAKHR